jgi:outer membrane protein assembly factor BamB
VGIDPENGTVLWKHPHRNKWAVHANTPVAVAPDMVVVASGYGFGAQGLQVSASGVKQVWENKDLDVHFQGMVLIGKRLYLTPSHGSLLCVNPETGVVLARAEGVDRASIIATETGIVGYEEGKSASAGKVTLVKLNGDQMQTAGSIPVKFGNHENWSSPVIADGVLYIRHGDALAAYDLKAGH